MKRMPLRSIVWVVWLSVPAIGMAADVIHAGPVYTAAKGTPGLPAFPTVQILVELPPSNPPAAPKPESFELKVDGGAGIPASSVQTLLAAGYGMAAAVVLDASGSMKGRPLDAVRTGLTKFVDQSGPQDRVAILTVADESRWDAKWGDTTEQLRAAIAHLESRGSFTVLWDGVIEALGNFPDSPLARRVIVISDGHDEGSHHTLREAIDEAARRHIVIDAIGITRDKPKYLEDLKNLATSTGGVFRVALDEGEIENFVGNGIQRLKTLSVATFQTTGVPEDGKSHTFAVTWKGGSAPAQGEAVATVPASHPEISPPPPQHQSQNQPPSPSEPGPSSKNRGMLMALLVLLLVILIVTLGLYFFLTRNKPPVQPVIPTVPVNPDPPPAPAPGPYRPVTRDQTVPGRDLGPEPVPFDPSRLPGTPPPVVPLPVTPAARKATQIAARFSAPGAGSPAAWLQAEGGPQAGRWFSIETAEFWIGCVDLNNLALADATVSGHHACIAYDSGSLTIWDHNSTNGTFVNGEQVSGSRRLLRPGDRIRIGQTTFTLLRTRENA